MPLHAARCLICRALQVNEPVPLLLLLAAEAFQAGATLHLTVCLQLVLLLFPVTMCCRVVLSGNPW